MYITIDEFPPFKLNADVTTEATPKRLQLRTEPRLMFGSKKWVSLEKPLTHPSWHSFFLLFKPAVTVFLDPNMCCVLSGPTHTCTLCRIFLSEEVITVRLGRRRRSSLFSPLNYSMGKGGLWFYVVVCPNYWLFIGGISLTGADILLYCGEFSTLLLEVLLCIFDSLYNVFVWQWPKMLFFFFF